VRAVSAPRLLPLRGTQAGAWCRSSAAVLVTGELDLATVPSLRARLDAALGRRPACLEVDLSGCTFLDCSAVDLLLAVRDAAYRDGVVLVLVRPSRPVRRLLSLLGLDEAFALG